MGSSVVRGLAGAPGADGFVTISSPPRKLDGGVGRPPVIVA
jgi:hypothetical protein